MSHECGMDMCSGAWDDGTSSALPRIRWVQWLPWRHGDADDTVRVGKHVRVPDYLPRRDNTFET